MAETRQERLLRRARRIRNRQDAVNERVLNLEKLTVELAEATADVTQKQDKVVRITGQIASTQAAITEALDRLDSAILTDEDAPPA